MNSILANLFYQNMYIMRFELCTTLQHFHAKQVAYCVFGVKVSDTKSCSDMVI